MKRVFVCVLITMLLLAVFTACGKSEAKEVFGECVISADYEDLTQDEYTAYLKEAYGLDALLAHKVYHSNGRFQVDFQFSEDVKDWQIDSAEKFSVDKFYTRDVAKYDLWDYDTWLIEHSNQEVINVTYRIFTESKLTSSSVYPETK